MEKPINFFVLDDLVVTFEVNIQKILLSAEYRH